MGFVELIESGALQPLKGSRIDSSADLSRPFVALNPSNIKLEVAGNERVQLVVVYTESGSGSMEIDLKTGAKLSLTELYLADRFASVAVKAEESSECEVLSAVLCNANVAYETRLLGRGAMAQFDGLFMASEGQHATLSLTTRHEVADCNSRSLVKGVASARSTGEFKGLVYVAPDAQRTNAEQQNRNIEIGGGRIQAKPQLEIYADDVRCSHGATVGQADEEALFYMRQRGINLADARRMLLEGFAQDVTLRCSVEAVCPLLAEAVAAKMLKM